MEKINKFLFLSLIRLYLIFEMVLNNISRVLPLLVFKEGYFYFLQVIARKKDNPSQSRDLQLFSKCVTRKESLDLILSEVELLCNSFNARCYISLLPRSIEEFVRRENYELSRRIVNNSFTHKVFRVQDSVALDKMCVRWKGVIPSSRCMIDVDDMSICSDLDKMLSDGGVNIEAKIPSFSGIHYVCSNFYPANIGGRRKGNSEDWEIDLSGRIMTICRDVNVILYAKKAE